MLRSAGGGLWGRSIGRILHNVYYVKVRERGAGWPRLINEVIIGCTEWNDRGF
ncbi:MAG: hypothetical protein SWO11_17660 [Thermodesulfobacteriota bacterium]|nr:hypothetical protein [Thermodesulfobacteriota bacterium]